VTWLPCVLLDNIFGNKVVFLPPVQSPPKSVTSAGSLQRSRARAGKMKVVTALTTSW
jgi:hypothetical protein